MPNLVTGRAWCGGCPPHCPGAVTSLAPATSRPHVTSRRWHGHHNTGHWDRLSHYVGQVMLTKEWWNITELRKYKIMDKAMIKIHIHNKDITYLMFISLIHFIFRTTKIHHLIQTSDFTFCAFKTSIPLSKSTWPLVDKIIWICDSLIVKLVVLCLQAWEHTNKLLVSPLVCLLRVDWSNSGKYCKIGQSLASWITLMIQHNLQFPHL